jgi:hypothetical protein
MVMLAAAALAVVGGVAWAGIPGGDGVIHGCYDSGGNLKVVDSGSACPRSYTALTWNQTGPQGIQGPQGIAGPKGDPGGIGPQGPQGDPAVLPSGTLTHYLRETLSGTTEGIGSVNEIVFCPAGKTAISGGYGTSGGSGNTTLENEILGETSYRVILHKENAFAVFWNVWVNCAVITP